MIVAILFIYFFFIESEVELVEVETLNYTVLFFIIYFFSMWKVKRSVVAGERRRRKAG